jgi:hypothetical protein
MTQFIALTRGLRAIVDDDDYDVLVAHSWTAVRPASTWYAQTNIVADGKRGTVQMHRLILDVPRGMFVDHRSRNGLDNRRANLRAADRLDNARNRIRDCSKTSEFIGVSFTKQRINPWRAQIQSKRTGKITIGFFANPIDAAFAWDEKAKELFGEFAALNFPDLPPPFDEVSIYECAC